MWPDDVDAVLAGDQVVALAHLTPARGVVVTPLTNFGVRDREAGTLTPVTSSIGMWRKLERIRRSPAVAVAYHTRKHGQSEREDYVLVQGRATLSPLGDRGWIDAHREEWDRAAGTRDVGPLWERWLRVYHWRVAIEIAVERIVVWPDLLCSGDPTVIGPPTSGDPAPQTAPARGTGPRVRAARVARRAARLPNVLLGWAGADGLPVVVPVRPGEAGERGIELRAPGLLPPGGRRAGLTAHSFARHTFGQVQRKHTGWLEVDPSGTAIYAPHTEAGHHLPESRTLYRMASGLVTRRGLRAAVRAGFVDA